MARSWHGREYTLSWYRDFFDDAEDREWNDLIRSAIETNNANNRENAAQSLDRLAKQAEGPWYASGLISGLRPIIIHIASIVPHDSEVQDNLVTFLRTLQRLPEQGEQYCPEWTDLFDRDFVIEFDECHEGA